MSTHAVVWTSDGSRTSGRLESFPDRFELIGRDHHLTLPFADLVEVAILRGREERLLGMPVLALQLVERDPVRIAALDGAGVLHELAARIEQARESL